MQREPQRLDGHFDLLVIGGGIYGAWIAYDAALRGLSVALVEREDWASGTSSASSKLIHGGLRYLEYGEIGLVRKALRERGRLLRLGPHRVRGLRFLLPHYRDSRMPRLPMLAGLWLYDHLAGARPDLPAHRAVDAAELTSHAPFLHRTGLVGGWSYSDAGEDDARMVLELVAGALAAGVIAVNHCRAERLLRTNGGVAGALVRDTIGNGEYEVRAAMVIDAAGAWAAKPAGLSALPARHTKGVHLVMPPLPIPEAFLLTTRVDKRVFFLIPWYGATLVGTTDTDFHGDPDTVRVEDADVDYLLAAVRDNCPGLGWTRDDVRGSFAGLRTLRGAPGTPSSISREWELLEPEPGLLLPLGGKFTSARVEASRTVDRCLRLAGRKPRSSPTAQRPFPWRTPGDWSEWRERAIIDGVALGLDAATARNAAERFAATLPLLHQRLRKDPQLARRIHPDAPFCRGELVHAACHEQALTLRDVLRRRVPLLILARLDQAALADAAHLVGEVLNWDKTRRDAEIASLG